MRANVELGLLLDQYGALLTERQRQLLSLAVDDDLSLSEIAEQEGISRQGVQDALKKGEAQLHEYEAKLGMARKARALREGLAGLMEYDRADAALGAQVQILMEILDDGV
ncbi:MAG: DNA-binding protein [Christensenellaceae bacterium]|nr:DNA-binding protein [Christensenellaceae bacterium]